jgi:uncharacterized protein
MLRLFLIMPELFYSLMVVGLCLDSSGNIVKLGKGFVMMSTGEEELAQTSSIAMEEGDVDQSGTKRKKYTSDYYREIGRKGGIILKEQRGREYYRIIAQKGGRANVDKYGPGHFVELGKKGGNATKASQEPGFYSRIGKLGGIAKKQKREAKANLIG